MEQSLFASHLVAHRGLFSADAPENSLLAVSRAREAGFGVEVDVHVTAGGDVVVFHDHTLLRMCGRVGRVQDLTRGDLDDLELGGRGHRIPLLEEVLAAVDGAVPLFIEVKARQSLSALLPRRAQADMESVASRLHGYAGPVAVMAWDPRQLRWLRQHHPDVLRVQSGGVGDTLVMVPGLGRLLDDLLLNWVSDPHAVSYNAALLPRAAVSRVRRSGRPVLAWVARDAERLSGALKHADTAIFEGFVPASPDPARARKAATGPLLGNRDTLREAARALPRYRGPALPRTGALVAGAAVSLATSRASSHQPLIAALGAGVLASWQPRAWGKLVGVAVGGRLLAGPQSPAALLGVAGAASAGAFLGASLRAVVSALGVDTGDVGRHGAEPTGS